MRLDSQNRALNKATTILFFVSLLIPAISFSQKSKTISGKIPHVCNDTLIIYPDHGISDKFYEIKKSSFHIKNEEFTANLEISYPQLLYTIYSSDEGSIRISHWKNWRFILQKTLGRIEKLHST